MAASEEEAEGKMDICGLVNWWIGESTTSVTYHSTLNVIIVTTKESGVKVIDVSTGSVLQKSDLCASQTDNIQSAYLSAKDKVLFTDGLSVGVRKDLSGMLLLDTLLQAPVASTDDVVKVELPLQEANHLFQECLMSGELPGVDGLEDVIRELEKGIEKAQESVKGNHKVAKWATVCIRLPHHTLKSVCSTLMTELKKYQQNVSSLPVASAVTERLNSLYPTGQPELGAGPIDRSMMYSEAARRASFTSWPHMNYKWALPEPMAQAGFYHQPNSVGDDRAMCFTCSVCLVCWEPTDEPWSEHERHSPGCPFVKGQFTQNVPLSVTYATEPAQVHGISQEKVKCISTTSCDNLVATSSTHGYVIVWDIGCQMKKHIELNIDPGDPLIKVTMGANETSAIVTQSAQSGACKEPITDSLPSSLLETDSIQEDSMTGPGPEAGEIVSLPIESVPLTENCIVKRSRISRDVVVSSVSVIGDPENNAHQAASAPSKDKLTKAALVCGVGIRRTTLTCDIPDTMDVQAMNLVNEALSSDTSIDILSEQSQDEEPENPFIPCILIHDIQKVVVTRPIVKKLKSAPGSAKSTVSEMYMPQIMEVDEEPEIINISEEKPIPGGSGTTNDTGNENCHPLQSGNQTSIKNLDLMEDSKEGRVVQCVPLPEPVSKAGFSVTHILPVSDNHHLLVVVAPTQVAQKHASPETTTRDGKVLKEKKSSQKDKAAGGCILLYKINFDTQTPTLETDPRKIFYIPDARDAVVAVLSLPLDISSAQEEDELINMNNKETVTIHKSYSENLPGQIAISTEMGKLKIIRLSDFKVLESFESSDEGQKFVSLTYCTGMERLCACTGHGKLSFFQVAPKDPEFSETDMVEHSSPVRPFSQDSVDGSMDCLQGSGNDLLVKHPLTTEVLMTLHELTQFENLIPRFTATVPPCWQEIQQEQQHRRHPQHLQQQGEALQHTRSWRLQHEKGSCDEHLFELVLPRPCTVGHVDIKFNLLSVCTSLPNIQVTLLKQNITDIGQQVVENCDMDKGKTEVDDKINFSVEKGGEGSVPKDTVGEKDDKDVQLSSVNNVHDPDFLGKHHAEILCGPVDLASHVDLSGKSGLITLTSSKLLKVKSRSFLLHIKALKEEKTDVRNAPVTQQDKEADKNFHSIWDQFFFGGAPSKSSKSGQAGETSKQKLENIKGCDWLAEISVTIRKTKRNTVPKDRLQRCTMLEMPGFHEHLLLAACGADEESIPITTSLEHRQVMALDILCWIAAIHIRESEKRLEQNSFVFTVQSNLEGLIKACFIEGGRSIAHKCAKLVALCLECTELSLDPDLAPAFSFALLTALLNCLPLLPLVHSAGALRWFFTVLNRVKFMDISQTGQMVAEMLSSAAKQYSLRVTPLDALLKSRFGLYGHPCDPDLFDVEMPIQQLKPTQPTTYASMTGASTSSSSSGNSPQGYEEVDFQDLINLDPDKTIKSGTQGSEMGGHTIVNSLLEVEPLHFTCHATSDGTRMEKADITTAGTNSLSNTSGLSGTINFGDSLATVSAAAAAAGAALQSLSTAMVSAEQHFSLSQHKQAQLLKVQQQTLKLKQKLAETQKSVAAASAQPQIDIFPPTPTPKTTPLFMTPPVTPPNEAYLAEKLASNGVGPQSDQKIGGKNVIKVSSGKPDNNFSGGQKTSSHLSSGHQLLHPASQHVLVIERMHSGARRFVVLDFGKPILLTDVVIPACGDLASLSIDVWIHGEEIDGMRLVIASDIGLRSLIMNDLSPPPLCRYLKITTVGRYGGNTPRCTSRSRIPIGTFYGHSFILPWEYSLDSVPSVVASELSTLNQPLTVDQSEILSQLSMFITLQEDIQCRYSLACTRLQSLVASLDLPPMVSGHAKYYLRKGKKVEEDARILQAYNDCTQLQLQLNLAQRAIERLQKALGMKQSRPAASSNTNTVLRQVSTDKLRVLTELLLDCLLSMTRSKPTIPHPPLSLYRNFNPQTCEALFKHICVFGTRRMQIHAGLLLVRVGGRQSWWGQFLGNMLQQLFSSDLTAVFPQDRIFVLLTALGQKALTSTSASNVLESLLTLLGKILSPLLHSQGEYYRNSQGSLDMDLVGWVLLFLSRTMDAAGSSNNGGSHNGGSNGKPGDGGSDEGTKGSAGAENDDAGKENGTMLSARWDFIQGDTAMEHADFKPTPRFRTKLYRRQLAKRLMHHKSKLIELQKAKKEFLATQVAAAAVSKEAEVLVKQQEQEFIKELKKYSSKHFKDIMQIRRIDAEVLRKKPKDDSNGVRGDQDGHDTENSMVLPRERCLPVVRGLIALLLSMDFTCNVDLFLIACKVVARITNSTRPAITLSEAMTQEQLEQLLLLCSNLEHNHGNLTWGGPWSGHAITCMIQDVLDGERLYPPGDGGSSSMTEEELSAAMTETDDSIHHSASLPQIDDSGSSGPGGPGADMVEAYPVPSEPIPVVGTIEEIPMDISEDQGFSLTYDDLYGPGYSEPVTPPELLPPMPMPPLEGDATPPEVGSLQDDGYKILFDSAGKALSLGMFKNMMEGNKKNVKVSKIKMSTNLNRMKKGKDWLSGPDPRLGAMTKGTSAAMDARLEFRVDWNAELKLRVMQSLEAESVQSAISSVIPPAPQLPFPQSTVQNTRAVSTDDEQLSETSFYGEYQNVPSNDMLSQCFDNLFMQLYRHRVNLDTILQLWLIFNDDSSQEETTQSTFDPSRVPMIPLSQAAVASLLTALAYEPNVPVRTWTLFFQVLTLLMNVKHHRELEATAPALPAERWLASVVVTDDHLMPVLIKFLTGVSYQGPVLSNLQDTQVGPFATKMFHEFLVRLQLRTAEDNEKHLKELMLKLVYMLTTERGAFHCGHGPLDAQCKLLDYVLDQQYDSVDISNAISVIESISVLVHHHILSQERVLCKSQSDGGVSARSCFGGLFSSLLRPGDSKSMVGEANRDVLMCSLLKLVNKLIQVVLPGRNSRGSTTEEEPMDVIEEPLTDSSKLSQSRAGNNTTVLEGARPIEAWSKSDEEKSSETDEQKTETASSQANTPTAPQPKKACSHGPDMNRKEHTLSDVILTHEKIMTHLLEALSFCNSSTMATILCTSGLQGSMQDTFTGLDVLSVGDGIFQILCTLNKKATDMQLIVGPMYKYLSSGFRGTGAHSICKLSEPLLWFILRVLDCDKALSKFLEFGGVEVICRNLVQSNRRVISTGPSLISTIMQYLGSSKMASYNLSKSRGSTDTEAAEGLQNFAPLGSISSSSPTASPAEVLVQASPPHRRARSAAWSYHYYPDEAWVDLTIQLPCAVLLKEVQIQPHLTSLATCPAAVSVEVSRDVMQSVPISPPVVTSGLTFIKIQLLKPEVATAVTIRLHKPKDSTTVGLSQILLMGYTAFGDSSYRNPNVFAPSEDFVSRTSIGWLRLLHHCLSHVEAMAEPIAAAAAPTPHLLSTCTALLVTPATSIYSSNIEAVLLKIGLHSTDMGLALLDNLLRNTVSGEQDQSLLHGKVNGVANDSTIDIIYQLCMTQDAGTAERIRALVDWLGDTARVALQKIGNISDDGYRPSPRDTLTLTAEGLPNPAPAHIHCIASVFWHSQELTLNYNLGDILTKELLSSLYEWSAVLPASSTLKTAVDSVICSACYIHPEYFSCLMEWMGIIVSMEMSVTDDFKDVTQSQQNQESMTDDSKEASNVFSLDIEQTTVHQPMTLQDLGHMILDEVHLATLGVACQSESAVRQLLESGFPAMLAQAMYEFCNKELGRYSDSLSFSEKTTDSVKTNNLKKGSRRKESVESLASDKGICLTADLVAPVLHFFTTVTQESVMKDWLGDNEGNIFWSVLLNMLCNTPAQTALLDACTTNRCKVMSGHQRAAIESAAVVFFTKVVTCHSTNQKLFAQVLCDVIKGQGSPHAVLNQGNLPLSGFTRRLFLQVLLEDEKILVAFKSSSSLYKGTSNASTSVLQHPKFGAGHKFRTMELSLQMTCGEVLSKVSDTPSLTAQLLESREEKKKLEALADKDTNDLALEVMEDITQAAGFKAKDKRDKDKQNSQVLKGNGLPPRPPARLGYVLADKGAGSTFHIPLLTLFHDLMPGQALPSDLSLSQLLVLLHHRGFPEGYSALEFTLRLRARKITAGKPEKRGKGYDPKDPNQVGELVKHPSEPEGETIPDEVLLQTPSYPSALQVFASVGGLALLAEHLPLLYPEISRHVSPTEGNRDASSNSLGHDWVTIEGDDIFEDDIYEPISHSQPSQSSRQNTFSHPSVPPHSMVAFGLFLRLPGYAEVLLKERKRAQCLLRLVLGVTDDGDGGHILSSSMAGSLPTLPFHVLRTLFAAQPLTTDDGVVLRRMTLEIGALHLILACLSVLSHHGPREPLPGFHQEPRISATQVASCVVAQPQPPQPPFKLIQAATSMSNWSQLQSSSSSSSVQAPVNSVGDEKSQHYWAKGTGFGTGSTTSSWDAEQALLRQKSEEEHVTYLLQVLASYINPGGAVPKDFESPEYPSTAEKMALPANVPELLSQSCLVPAISSYLRNDSVLDMARHVPLYKSLLELLRAIAVCPLLVPLLLPLDKEEGAEASVETLLEKMKACVDTYASRLNCNSKGKTKSRREDDDESEGLALLIPDIQETARMTKIATDRIKDETEPGEQQTSTEESRGAMKDSTTSDANYMEIMKELQFDTHQLLTDESGTLKFLSPHHYESNVRSAGEINNPARSRRLAQEAVTLSTSLPLSASSSVFVRCDEERLDIMKVLITGPADTPYANGCFEFDVYFPQDYPNSPPLINLETTGNHIVRFNPNLYNDGKVCLSVLNTWHGRPEEKWNSQTSSFLQVLVSIQSLILVSEPYFNEPGYERSRGTPSGTASSREYDANIRQATVKWAMLEMLKNPTPCLKEVIHKHFWLKRREITAQVEEWIQEMESYSGDKRTGRAIALSNVALKRHFAQLKEEFAKMKPPEGLEEEEPEQNTLHGNPPETTNSNHNGVEALPHSSNGIDSYNSADSTTKKTTTSNMIVHNSTMMQDVTENGVNNNSIHAEDQNPPHLSQHDGVIDLVCNGEDEEDEDADEDLLEMM
ncbi:baculoviral IAP repeat-containing protein 6 [Lingula anatina]|uniref:Dual E2 ubiquitin-conjugating enzyme/E3 ubiquitin-protein ligase BIRC6 n=1 Tax=Lingula anatina TaxID=7574 RepID=A0A1S3K4H8_LINAN|nr:baculoviral IAP repeat-containing protein 6 [Lingula anatina]|eukprot:XP_013417535.1 baculoviral IAP repeat-containing protein 6 [Lingula anatina]